MNLLILTYDLPYPPDSGGKIRAYNLIKYLSGDYQIYLLSFTRKPSQNEQIEELKRYCRLISTIPRGKVWTPRNLFKTLLSFKPLAINAYESKEMKKAVRILIKEIKFDLVLLESFYTSGYLSEFDKEKVILGTENIEYLVYQRYINNFKLSPLRPLMSIDVLKMKRFEEKSWAKASGILAVSETDAQAIRAKTPSPICVVPNGVDVDFLQRIKPVPHNEKRALFVGNWTYIQNIDAGTFLVKEIWPLLKKEIPDLSLWLVGRNPPEGLTKLVDKRMKFISDADDIGEIYSQVDVSLVPIRAASGTRLKALESFAAKIPVVSTRVGVEGLAVRDGQEVLFAENPPEFVEAIKKVLRGRELRQSLISNSFKLVKKNYDWPNIVEKLKKFYNNILES